MIKSRLKELLNETHTSVNQLSERIGINRTPLTQLLNNKTKMIKFETLEKIMNYFNIADFNELLKITFDGKMDVKSSKIASPTDKDFVGATLINDNLGMKTYITGSENDKLLNLDAWLEPDEDKEDNLLTNRLYALQSQGNGLLEIFAVDLARSLIKALSKEELSDKIDMKQFHYVVFRFPDVFYLERIHYLWNIEDVKNPQFIKQIQLKYGYVPITPED